VVVSSVSVRGEADGVAAGAGEVAGMFMPGISRPSCASSLCGGAVVVVLVVCGPREVEVRVEVLFRGAAFFLGAFGFGLLAFGIVLMSCPSCWARAVWPGSSALKPKQAAISTIV
jgi:hypothetical protein